MEEKILIVDDDQDIVTFLEEAVKQKGFIPLSATTSTNAIQLFEKELPKIVITDLKLPDIEGFDLIRSIRQINPFSEIILITGHGDFDTAIFALREDVRDYLIKPINSDDLYFALERCQKKIEVNRKLRTKPVLLLLEDESSVRNRLKRILSEEGWTVLTASDGEEGMSIFKEQKVDIVLADYRMPKKNGLELLQDINKLTDDCEVIIFSGYGDENIVTQLIRAGANNFLKKPIDLDQLLNAVQKAWQKLLLRRSLVISYPSKVAK